jgi:predicted DsbA family dithiol-disulfide isomerase
VRVQILKEEFGDRLELDWRSFLLRPHAEDRNLDKFRRYTQSWLKVAADQPAGTFNPWSTDENPPSHSIPPHLVAKAALALGEDAFHEIHEALLKAYFVDNRDVSNEALLQSIWESSGLEASEFERSRHPEILKKVIDEHNEALTCGASGAPAFRMATQEIALVGALPVEALRRWINRVLDEEV